MKRSLSLLLAMVLALGFEHGGYEVHKCKFAPDTGEAIAEKFVEMLHGQC